MRNQSRVSAGKTSPREASAFPNPSGLGFLTRRVSPAGASSGFTLIEMLIVIGLLGVFAAVATDTFTNIMRAQNKARVINELEQSGNYALSLMEGEIRDAREITAGCDGGSRLVIKTETEEVEFGLVDVGGNGAIRRQVIGGGSEHLTDIDRVSGVDVSTLTFECSSDRSRATITLELWPASGAPTRQDFQTSPVELRTTVVVRGRYQ